MRVLFKHEKVRFLMTGGLNTLFSYSLYLALNLFLNYSLAYSIAYISGIIFSYYLTTGWVFKKGKNWKSFSIYPLVYLAQYLLNIFLLNLLINKLGISETLSPLLIIVITLPVTYFLSKKVVSISSTLN